MMPWSKEPVTRRLETGETRRLLCEDYREARTVKVQKKGDGEARWQTRRNGRQGSDRKPSDRREETADREVTGSQVADEKGR